MIGSSILAMLDVLVGGTGGSSRGVLTNFFGRGEITVVEESRAAKGDGGVKGRPPVYGFGSVVGR